MSGIRRSLHTMMERATVSTTTIAVAAERPPRNATNVKIGLPALKRQRQKVHVMRRPPCSGTQGCQAMAIGTTKIFIRNQIHGNSPGGFPQFVFGDVFDERDVKLPRQQKYADKLSQVTVSNAPMGCRYWISVRSQAAPTPSLGGFRCLRTCRRQRRPLREKGRDLDNGLDRNRQH